MTADNEMEQAELRENREKKELIERSSGPASGPHSLAPHKKMSSQILVYSGIKLVPIRVSRDDELSRECKFTDLSDFLLPAFQLRIDSVPNVVLLSSR